MIVTDIETFLKYFENIRARTERVVARIPAELMDWAPRPGAFSFGDLIRHVGATERYMFAENASGRPSRYPGHGPEIAADASSPVVFLRRMHEETLAILRELRPAQIQATCTTPGGATLPVWKWLRAMVEHEVHHRGQIYLMLALVNVPTPPLYGLTSEEVRARSV